MLTPTFAIINSIKSIKRIGILSILNYSQSHCVFTKIIINIKKCNKISINPKSLINNILQTGTVIKYYEDTFHLMHFDEQSIIWVKEKDLQEQKTKTKLS